MGKCRFLVSAVLGLTLLCVLVFAGDADAKEGKRDAHHVALRPCIPVMESQTAAVLAGTSAASPSIVLNDALLAPITQFTDNQASYVLNFFKGSPGENLMDDLFTSSLLQRTGGWGKVTPANVGRNGIDGIYIKLDEQGLPRQLLISDAKMNSARLGTTVDGKQMSESWIRPRLQRTADSYRNLASDMQKLSCLPVSSSASSAASKKIVVMVKENVYAEVWKTERGYAYFCKDKTVASEQIRVQAERIARTLKEAADGAFPYRSRLFSYKAENGEHVISIRMLNADGNTVKTGERIVFRGTYNNLPKEIQRVIRHTVIRTLGTQKNAAGGPRYSVEELKAVTLRLCQNPEEFNRVCVAPKFTAAHVRAVAAAGNSALIMGGIDAVTQYLTTGNVDWYRTRDVALITGGSTMLGAATASALQKLISIKTSMFIGGSVAAVGVSWGMYAFGYCTAEDAFISTLTGVASAGAVAATPAVLMGFAMYFGTASSGAAATNAALAWLGGGSIAAGGGGMAAGGAVIMGATAGVAIIVVAIPAIYSVCKYFSDEKSQGIYLRELVALTSERVQHGTQVEWNCLPQN